jgi:hypothetical protein
MGKLFHENNKEILRGEVFIPVTQPAITPVRVEQSSEWKLFNGIKAYVTVWLVCTFHRLPFDLNRNNVN